MSAATAAPPHPVEAAIEAGGLVLEGGVETGLGGVLFLINLLCALDLPECFEDDWHLASALGPWGTLEALVRGLLADTGDRWVEDSLWPVLADLAKRAPHESLGAALTPPPVARLPHAWSNWLDNAAESLPADPPAAPPASPLIAPAARPLRRWLELVLPAVYWRLARALGAGGSSPDLETALLARRGRLYLSALHLDLVLPLEAIDLPARLAGLDRDPGWLPEFGRVIKFHFE